MVVEKVDDQAASFLWHDERTRGLRAPTSGTRPAPASCPGTATPLVTVPEVTKATGVLVPMLWA